MEKTELKMPATLVTNDALSSLIQLNARRLGVCLKWKGAGLEDLMMLIQDDSSKTILTKQLWTGLQELLAMPEMKDLPEPIFAKIHSIILAMRTRVDLALMKRNARAKGQSGEQPVTPEVS